MKNKCKILFLCLLFFSYANAVEPDVAGGNDEKINQYQNELNVVYGRLSELGQRIDELNLMQSELNNSIEKSAELQSEIHSSASNLQSIIQHRSGAVSAIPVKLIQSTNWSLFILPVVTIFIVISGTALSVMTIIVKSKESIVALEKSNQVQLEINKNTISSDLNKTQQQTIANNRQQWINSLRDEITSLLTVLVRASLSPSATQSMDVLEEQVWFHLYKVRLLLNPKENDHNKLVDCFGNIAGKVLEGEKCHDDLQDAVEFSQAILKREWERVKKFE